VRIVPVHGHNQLSLASFGKALRSVGRKSL
jgi:hypothetical protein